MIFCVSMAESQPRISKWTMVDFTLPPLDPVAASLESHPVLNFEQTPEQPSSNLITTSTTNNNTPATPPPPTRLPPPVIRNNMANVLPVAWHRLVAAISYLFAIFSRHGRARLRADQEQRQALRELDELSTLLEFISVDLESFRPHGNKLDA
jgi:hypothetical protein